MDGFDWDDANRDHLAKHGVSVEEAEDVCLRETLFLDSYLVDGEWRVESTGCTRRGRILVLVTTDRDERIRVRYRIRRAQKAQAGLPSMDGEQLMIQRIVPHFDTEKEEADWWYENREKHAEEFLQAAAEGRVKRGNLREHFAELRRTTMITLDPKTASEVQELAQRRGMEVPDLLKTLVHETLQREKQLAG